MASRVKNNRLTETDLARVAPLPLEQKYSALSQTKSGFPLYNYTPVRESFPDILNLTSGLLLETSQTPWKKIRAVIRKACRRSTAERIANVQVGTGLHDYSAEKGIVGRHHDFRQLKIAGQLVAFWSNIIIRIDGVSYVPFFDPRRTKGLNHDAMRFAFSAMHEHIRAADPDFADVKFVIFRFADTKKGPRVPIPYFDKDFELYDYATLDRMVRETYEVYAKVLADRAAEKLKKAS